MKNFITSATSLSLFAALLLISGIAFAATGTAAPVFDWTMEPIGLVMLAIFVVAYAFVVAEEHIHLSKSKPVMLAAAIIWGLIAWKISTLSGVPADTASVAFRHIFMEFAELFFFLIVAMSYVSAMTERNIFEALRAELVSHGLSFRQLFWITGVLSFFLSAVLDNLTASLIMSGVILAVGKGNARFISIAFVNVVVAANAGGAWSAFGDITTLMVWQAHKVEFFEFFRIFVPSVVNYIVPAFLMHWAVPKELPTPGRDDADIKFGGIAICVLFGITIAITVTGKQLLHMPPVYGMMAGLALLKIFSYFITHREKNFIAPTVDKQTPFSIFRIIANAEWDTLLFFYGVLLCVGGLGTAGYLAVASAELYGTWGHTWANVVLGIASAIVDNIPVMYAVLQMSPPLDHGQWLLITLTCGVGGSMLSVGSAAGVALMGQSKGMYTFFSHLKWTWAIFLGYVASVITHLWWNADYFTNGIWY